jgi:predicted N-acetyltransferase YhbS
VALGVLPEYQGKGIGRKLVKWGMDSAAKEGIHASVISAPGKEPFYYKVGFEYQLGTSAMGEGNPLATVG